MFDVLIRNGTVIDGTGAERTRADVGIRGDRIEGVGSLVDASAAVEIDARGKIVAPGFVDVHNHSDGWLIKKAHLVSNTTQGFTTEIITLDGIGYAPVNEHTARQWVYYLRALDGLRMDEYEGWQSIEEFMQRIHGRNAQNAGTHIPYANVRSMACGFGPRVVDDFQRKLIEAEVRKGMEEGAVGISTGIDYIVQCYATTEELVNACRVVAEFGGLYATHMRYKSGRMPALREAVEICRRSGARLHISHLKGESAAASDEILSYIDNEARHEVDLTFDVYPYQPGSTMLSYLLPYEVWDDGPLAVMSKLHEPAIRARFRDAMRSYRLGFEKLTIAWVSSAENKRLQGTLLSDYIDQTGLAPEDAIFDLLAEERLGVLLVFNEGDDELVQPFLSHDLYMMGSDGIYQDDAPVHPRQYGSTGRFLGPCVRDLQLFSLEDAIRKLSGFPAERFGLADRGVIAEGKFADVVVFDAETITDLATYETPALQSGVEHVLVNGVPILRDGMPVETMNAWPGRYVRYERQR